MTKTSERLIAVIDLGTTGNRSVLYNLKGREIAKSYREFPTFTDESEQAEQDAMDWWRTTKETMREVTSQKVVEPKDIVAISVVTQRATLVPLSKNGDPLARAITWMDMRISPSAEQHEDLVKQRTSLRRALWFKDMQPQVFKKTAKFATPDAFLYHQLTGNLVSDPTNHHFGILDEERLVLDETLGEELDLPISMWPDLVHSGKIIGNVTKDSEKETGLPKGVPVVVGGGDQQCSALGLGVLEQGVAKLTLGTGTFVVTPVDKILKDPLGVLFNHPHVLPNQRVQEGVLPGMGTILRWFRDEFGHVECAVAERLGTDPYEYIVDEAAQAPPGCDGLALFPFFIWGMGAIQGLGFQHTRSHIARAILESVAFASRFIIDSMFSVGITLNELRLDGGGARSALWRQIMSDVSGKPCIFTQADEGTALGASILAAVGLKLFPSVEKAVKIMVHKREELTPNPKNAEVYGQGYSTFQQTLMSNLQELLKHV
ncbi:MAG: FGGY-family carbohydrate kinase [Candidatus Thorarchaeota archaeon]